MAFTKNCDDTITREHYISHSVLTALGDQVVCSGLPWQAQGDSASYGKNSLTAHVLCERHNNAFSPIDEAAVHFFTSLRDIAAKLGRKAWSKRLSVRVVRGELIELWALKTLMGIFHAGIAQQDGMRLRGEFNIPEQDYCAFLTGTCLRMPLGLYIDSSPDRIFQLEHAVAMAPLTNTKTNNVAGLWMKIAGYDIKFIFHAAAINFSEIRRGHVYRPTDLIFVSSESVDERVFVFKLGWSTSIPPHTITFTQSGSP